MTPKTVDSMVKSHRDFVRSLERQLKLRDQGKSQSTAMQRKEKERFLTQLKKRLEVTIAARKKVIARYDEEVRRREEQVRQLEDELGRGRKAGKERRDRAKPNG